MQINVNRLYNLLQTASVENQTVEPFLDGGKLVKSAGELKPELKEKIKEFRQGLFNSLCGMGVDQAVINELREKLGVPENNNVSDRPLEARNVKAAIDAVMAQVDARIGNILGKNFPRDVQPLIREAVRENSQHEVVKALLAPSGDTVANLARLCRLTMQSQAKTAHLWELSYLKGFSYKVENDIDDVRLVNNYDEAAERIGKKDYDDALDEETVKMKGELKQTFTAGTSEAFAGKVVDALFAKIDGKAYRNELLQGLLSDKKEAFAGLMKDAYEKCDKDLTEDERALILARELVSAWPKGAKTVDAYNSCFATAAVEVNDHMTLVASFRTALAACKDEIEQLKASRDKDGSELLKQVKNDFLDEVGELGGLLPQGTLYQDLCAVRRAALDKNEPVDAKLADALKKAILKRLELTQETLTSLAPAPKKIGALEDLPAGGGANVRKEGDAKEGEDVKNKMLGQGNTQMCYVRSIENALIAKGRLDLLPKLEDDTYTFPVKLGQDIHLTVTKNEIESLKSWYQQKHPEKGTSKLQFLESDWAVNLAMAKLAMFNEKQGLVENEQQKVKKQEEEIQKKVGNGDVNDGVKVAKPADLTFADDNLGSGYDGDDGKFGYATYLERQFITTTGFDDTVSELFGLGVQPINVSVNFDSNLALYHREVNQGRVVGSQRELSPAGVFSEWNSVREWINANPGGVVALNEASVHTVMVTGCYYASDDDYGFVVRDSQHTDKEQQVNVVHYKRNKNIQMAEGECSTLNVHCYVLPEVA